MLSKTTLSSPELFVGTDADRCYRKRKTPASTPT